MSVKNISLLRCSAQCKSVNYINEPTTTSGFHVYKVILSASTFSPDQPG